MKSKALALLLGLFLLGCSDSPASPGLDPQIEDSIGPGELNQHIVTVPASGLLQVHLSWRNRNIDLDLYITAVDCEDDPLTHCTVLAASSEILRNWESTGLGVEAGEQYKVWVANFDDERSVDYGIAHEVS